MTGETVGAGWGLVIGSFLILAGVLVMVFWSRDKEPAECSCARRERYLAELLAEDESKVWAESHVAAALSVARLAPVAPVIAFPSQRVPGSES